MRQPSYEEEDTCMSYEEEDTCIHTGLSLNHDTCVSLHMRRRIHACHMRRRIYAYTQAWL